jgi:membrane protein DedA with SNARE-associated domain
MVIGAVAGMAIEVKLGRTVARTIKKRPIGRFLKTHSITLV